MESGQKREIFKLTEDLYTNLKSVDEQHAELFNRLNDLIFAISEEKEDVEHFLDFLNSYVVEHFGLEERFMKEHSYPDEQSHIRRHRLFTGMLESLKEEYRKGEVSTGELVQKLEVEIGYWFVEHISREDKRLTSFLLTKLPEEGE